MNKTLEELATITYGKDYKSNPLGETVPIYGTGGIMGYTSVALNVGSAVLTGRKGSINKPIFINGDFWNVDTIYCLKTKDNNSIKWLYYNLENTNLMKLNEATGVPSVSTSALNRLEFNFVDIPFQRKIARILSTVDNIIKNTEIAIEKYKAIKKGMIHDLLTRGIDVKTGKMRPKYKDAAELYKETEIGWIPDGWDIKPLEVVTDYVDYRGKTPPKTEAGIFLITARNIKMGSIDYNISKEYIPKYAYISTMSRGEALIGDVLITTEAPLGNVAQIDREGLALAQRVIKYRGKKGIIINNFLKYYFMSDYFQRLINSESTGSTVKGIKGSRLHRQNVLVPKEVKEQELISNSICLEEDKIENEILYLSKMMKLKSGLMQDLLTGKKSVTPDPEDYEGVKN